MLTVKNVTKKYRSFTALENVELCFDTGVHALLAPNGAGKTTLMKMLATLMRPTEGEILLDGEDIFKMDDQYRDLLGFLPQSFGFYRGYTVQQFLAYLAALKGLDKQTANKRTEDLLMQVGMIENRNVRMKNLSGGMLRRVGIAQALLNDPKIIILDEPTAGLDPKERVRFRNMISELGRERIVLLSTHIVSDVETVANHVILIKDHKIYRNESVSNLCNMLQGKLYERPVGIALRDGEIFLSERQDVNGMCCRFVSEKTPSDAVSVGAGLEDVFLYVYGEDCQ